MRILLIAVFSLFGSAAMAVDWPGFRGTGDSVASGKYPTKWTATEGIAWTVNLPGYGQSAPVIWGGTVYVTAVEGAQREKGFVLALDAKTGKEQWRHAFEPTQKAKWSETVSRAADSLCGCRWRVLLL